MARPLLFGAAYSVYVRIVRLVLAEKGVAYDHREVDIFAPEGPGEDYSTRHPFHRIPAFEYDGFQLFESAAISRYIDEAFAGPSLQPTNIHERARVNQILAILDNYAYRTLVWEIFVERIRKPEQGEETDEAEIEAALPVAATCLQTLAALSGPGPYFVGQAVSLADLHAAPMFAYFLMTPEGRGLMASQPRLQAWWQTMSARQSVLATRTPLES